MAVLFLAAFALYARTVNYGFISAWDDGEFVIHNAAIRGLTLANLRSVLTTPVLGNYAPLHLLSYMLDYSVWGLNPAGYHLSNVILHSLNAVLAFVFIKKITGSARVGFLSALLFAVHPLNVENVAWIAERKTLLTAFFSFAALIFYIDFSEGRSPGRYALCAACFFLAVVAKPLTVTLPLVLIAYEFFIRGERGRALLYPFPLFAVSLFGVAITLWSHFGFTESEQGLMTLSTLFGVVYPTTLTIYWKYLALIVWPVGLNGFYDTALYTSFLSPAVAASLAGLVALFIAVFWKGGARTKFWFLWFWIWLLPVSNLIPIPVYYADRYMYIPAIAFFVLVGSLVDAGLKSAPRGSVGRVAAYAVFAAILAFYSVRAFNRTNVWSSELVFWQDTAAKSPRLYKPRLNLGEAYEKIGRLDDAEREYLAAAALYPNDEVRRRIYRVRMKRLEPR